jgi:hypothetical protein
MYNLDRINTVHSNKMKKHNINAHIVGKIQKSNRKIAERCKIDTPNHIYMVAHFLDTGTSIKGGGVKLVP